MCKLTDTLEKWCELNQRDDVVWLIYRRGVVESVYDSVEGAMANARRTDTIYPKIVFQDKGKT